MSRIIDINTADMAVSRRSDKIRTKAVGSCVAIALYDKEAGIGGMAHAMLPSQNSWMSIVSGLRPAAEKAVPLERDMDGDDAPAKYVDEAIARLLEELERMGGARSRVKAKLIGGANMFKVLSSEKYGIGYRNIEMARARLEELGIPIEAEHTGGTSGRTVELDIESGLVEISTKI